MEGLGSISIEQAWAAASGLAGGDHRTSHFYSSRSPQLPAHHHHTQQPHLQHSTHSSAAASEASSSSSNSSSSHAVLRHQRSSPAGLSVTVVQIGSSSSSSAAVRDRLFEPLDAGAGRDHRDQGHQTAGQPIPIAQSRRRSLPAALPHSSTSITTFARSSSSNTNSSSLGLLQRRHSSGTSSSSNSSFLSNTAGQLLSSLTALGSLSRLSSSPVAGTNSSARSSSSSSSRNQSRVPVGRMQVQVRASASALGASRSALRQVLLVRSPAVLLDTPGSSSESYDDLLALDQFNVKRAVKPAVLASLPSRGADEADRQRAAQCFICFEPWRPQLAAAAAPAGSEGYPEKGAAAAAIHTKGGAVGVAAGVCTCRCRCNTAAGAHVGAALPHNTAAGDAVVLNVAPVHRQQQQQQQQVRLGCFGNWGAGMFRQGSAPLDSTATTAARSAAAPATPASRSPGADAHVQVVYSSSSLRGCRCSCTCGSRAMQAAAVKPAPPVTILQLPCGHEFCVGCISTWLAEHVTCPICRWSFPEAHTQLINMHK